MDALFPCSLRGGFQGVGLDLEVAGRDDLPLGVLQPLGRVLDDGYLRIRAERVPDHVEPVRRAKLLGFVPLVRRQDDAPAALPSLHFNAPDFHLPGGVVNDLDRSDVEALARVSRDPHMAHPHAIRL